MRRLPIVLALCLLATVASGQQGGGGGPIPIIHPGGGAGSGFQNNVTVANITAAGNFTIVLPPLGHSLQNITMTAVSNITIPKAVWPGQFMLMKVCQDSNGGNTPTFLAAPGLNLNVAVFPSATLTASKCDMYGIAWSSLTSANLTGYFQNE